MDIINRSQSFPVEDEPDRKKILDNESCQAGSDQKTNTNRQASATQEHTRVEHMDPETFSAHQTTCTSQEDTIVQNMYPKEEYAHQSQHAELEWTRLHHLSIQQQWRTRAHRT